MSKLQPSTGFKSWDNSKEIKQNPLASAVTPQFQPNQLQQVPIEPVEGNALNLEEFLKTASKVQFNRIVKSMTPEQIEKVLKKATKEQVEKVLKMATPEQKNEIEKVLKPEMKEKVEKKLKQPKTIKVVKAPSFKKEEKTLEQQKATNIVKPTTSKTVDKVATLINMKNYGINYIQAKNLIKTFKTIPQLHGKL